MVSNFFCLCFNEKYGHQRSEQRIGLYTVLSSYTNVREKQRTAAHDLTNKSGKH